MTNTGTFIINSEERTIIGWLEGHYKDKCSLLNKKLWLIGDLIEDCIYDELQKMWGVYIERLKAKNPSFLKTYNVESFISDFQSILNTIKPPRGLPRFTESIMDLFVISPLSRIVPKHNLLAASTLARRVTYFPSEESAEKDIARDKEFRDLDWTHYGRLCPLDTSQGEEVGITLSLAKNAVVRTINRNNIIMAPYRKVTKRGKKIQISKKITYLSAGEEQHVWIAYADQIKNLKQGKKVLARKGEIELQYRSAISHPPQK